MICISWERNQRGLWPTYILLKSLWSGKAFVSWPQTAHYILSWKSHHPPSWHPDTDFIRSSPATSGERLWTESVWGAFTRSKSWSHLSLPCPHAQFTLASIVFTFSTSYLFKVRDCIFCFVLPIYFLPHGFDNYCSSDNHCNFDNFWYFVLLIIHVIATILILTACQGHTSCVKHWTKCFHGSLSNAHSIIRKWA